MKESEIFKKRLDEGRKKLKSRRRTIHFQKWMFSIGMVVVASIPTVAFFLLKSELNPQTFWEKFAVWGGGLVFFGWFQIVLAIFTFGLLVTIWSD